ncbi:hypothetical protein GCM10007876_39990 [Litoribrevibacter albus]|uniref:Uncharacterized protein n=1 Tax=Litoribrevibacter albus TaxID=1473156 RepID=A0AA37SDN8_9GAMM|nr:hypothetical protein GCM10007876_39990 [Litoribrevibacter albus]
MESGVGAQADDVTRIGWNFRLVEHYIKHFVNKFWWLEFNLSNKV